jgi:hypothetical protein
VLEGRLSGELAAASDSFRLQLPSDPDSRRARCWITSRDNLGVGHWQARPGRKRKMALFYVKNTPAKPDSSLYPRLRTKHESRL